MLRSNSSINIVSKDYGFLKPIDNLFPYHHPPNKNCMLPKPSTPPFKNITISCSSSPKTQARTTKTKTKTKSSTTSKSVLHAVVKVFTTSCGYDSDSLPWQKMPPEDCSGSGFIISGRRIITNAHVIEDHILVLIRKYGCATKYRATVEAVSHDCDLAILTVQDEEFWKGTHPLTLGGIPVLEESVTVVGYPRGGDNISISKGVVSRIGFQRYEQNSTHLMTIQVDAAVNYGNSGGPVLSSRNKVVGVAFQSLYYAENINSIIPTPVINHFMSCLDEKGRHPGFCSLGVRYQIIENVQLRNYLGMLPGMTGILVCKISKRSSANKFLEPRDVILAFDGVKIAEDGTVAFRGTDRISFEHLVSMKKPSEKAVLKILRRGQVQEVTFEMQPIEPPSPTRQYDKATRYFMFAGLVFTPLETTIQHDEERVVISEVLSDEIMSGYEDFLEWKVVSVNGKVVESLYHLSLLVENCQEEYLVIQLLNNTIITLNYQMAKTVTASIMEQHRIPCAKSSDLMDQGIGKMQIATKSDVEAVGEKIEPQSVTNMQIATESDSVESVEEKIEPQSVTNMQIATESDSVESVGEKIKPQSVANMQIATESGDVESGGEKTKPQSVTNMQIAAEIDDVEDVGENIKPQSVTNIWTPQRFLKNLFRSLVI
ncbi:hypothetical protein ACFE04_029020 [Oxalis oulophora]